MEEKTNNSEQEQSLLDDYLEQIIIENGVEVAELQEQIVASSAQVDRIAVNQQANQNAEQRRAANFIELDRVETINQNRKQQLLFLAIFIGAVVTTTLWVELGFYAGLTSSILSVSSLISIPYTRRYWAVEPHLQVEAKEQIVEEPSQEFVLASVVIESQPQPLPPSKREVEEVGQDNSYTIIITPPDSVVTPLITARNNYAR